jgi:hypothetical protein
MDGWMDGCKDGCMHGWMYVCMYVCMYVFIYLFIYVFMCLCVLLYIIVYSHIHLRLKVSSIPHHHSRLSISPRLWLSAGLPVTLPNAPEAWQKYVGKEHSTHLTADTILAQYSLCIYNIANTHIVDYIGGK